MAEHIFNNSRGSFTLDLFPPDRSSTHRAWDAADVYLLEELHELPEQEPILLVNDSFGALTVSLKNQICHHMNDSAASQLCIKQNRLQNGQCTDLSLYEERVYPWVIIKIPKTLSLLEYQLREIRKCIGPESRIIAAGMTRHIHNSTIELFETILGPATTSLAKKKARLIHCSPDMSLELPQWKEYSEYSVPGIPEPLMNLPNLFSRERLDRGTELLLQYIRLPEEEEISIADFGSGNGVIGIYAAHISSQAMVQCLDDSLLAVKSSELNSLRNAVKKRVKSIHGCSLKELEGPFDWILSNPPFHQGQKVDMAPTVQFFKEALALLKPGGRLRIVANNHLGYHKQLEKIFGNCKTLAEKEGYIILESRSFA